MTRIAALFLVALLATARQGVIAEEIILRVLDTDGSAARVAAAVSVEIDLGDLIEGNGITLSFATGAKFSGRAEVSTIRFGEKE